MWDVSFSFEDGVLIVKQTGSLPDVEAAIEFQKRVSGAMQTHDCDRVVFDNRKTEPSGRDVVDEMRKFIATPGRFGKVSLVLDSAILVIGVNLDGMSRGVQLKAFGTLDEAKNWVTQN